MSSEKNIWWDLPLENKPDFEMAMKRIYAWYNFEIIDRAPIRFSAHNSFIRESLSHRSWPSIKDKWYDVEYQVESFIDSIAGKNFLAETFPVYFPNLGPNVFAAFYGATLDFGETTSWAKPCIKDWSEINKLRLDTQNEYFIKLEELTKYALDRCEGKFMVGYTDFHPGMDCVAAWRDTQSLCMDLYDYPDEVKQAIHLSIDEFQMVYDHFDAMLKARKQLSVTWMEIPFFGKMHIPSCDFSAMISTDQFIEYCLPILQKEIKPMTNNIWHLDGKGCARHLDILLDVPEIHAIQWVQGDGNRPIMQWVPLIKKIQAAGKSVVVDLQVSELEDFISAVDPKGLLLCLPVDGEYEQREVIKRVEKW